MESRKNVLFFSGQSTKREEGVKGCLLGKQELFEILLLICSHWKINYILFKTTYPNIILVY